MSQKTMVSGVCSVLITECEDVRIQRWAPLLELQDQVGPGFQGFRKSLFAYLPAIICSLVGIGQQASLIVDIRHQSHSCMLQFDYV